MKKTLVIVLALALVLAASALTLTACSGKEYEGAYSYAAWDYAKWQPSTTHQYGCKVKVTIQGDVVTKVVVEEDTDAFYNVSAGWTAAYGSEYGYDSEGKTNWRLHGQEMADSFVGLTTHEIMKIKVYVSKYTMSEGDVVPQGQPVTTSGVETIKYLPTQVKAVIGQYGDFGYTAGATQSSARLVLAIQDAILKSQGQTENPNIVQFDLGRKFTGECKYENTYSPVPGSYYGAKVDVYVADGKIVSVRLYTDAETGWTRTSTGWKEGAHEGDLGFANAEAAYESWMNSVFVGKYVSEVKAYVASATQEGQTVGTASANLVGATQSSARIICAVQDALSKIAD